MPSAVPWRVALGDGHARRALQAPSSTPLRRRWARCTSRRDTGLRLGRACRVVTVRGPTAMPRPVPRPAITVSGTPGGMSPGAMGATAGHGRADGQW